jgi:hypothetical protein
MRITTSGNVGIGTTNPTQKLDVTGTIGLTGVGVPRAIIADNYLILASGPSQDVVFDAGGAERARISSTGNVGIGTPTPVAKLEIQDGDIYIDKTAGKLIMKSPDGSCSACGPDNSDNWACLSVACP